MEGSCLRERLFVTFWGKLGHKTWGAVRSAYARRMPTASGVNSRPPAGDVGRFKLGISVHILLKCWATLCATAPMRLPPDDAVEELSLLTTGEKSNVQSWCSANAEQIVCATDCSTCQHPKCCGKYCPDYCTAPPDCGFYCTAPPARPPAPSFRGLPTRRRFHASVAQRLFCSRHSRDANPPDLGN